MANGLYQTEGIILGRMEVGEADRILSVFTKDFGLLKLLARGSRRGTSKLGKSLNLFSYGRFGFVSGKETWHLIDAESTRHFEKIFENSERIFLLGRISNFLERFHRGEGRDPVMFQLVSNTLDALESFPPELLRDLELLFYAKSLIILGYMNEDIVNKELRNFLEDTSFKKTSLPLSAFLRKELYEAIQKSIARSQL